MWDLVVIGGGTSGVAAAVSAAKNGVKTLLIEKMSFLGGAATAGLVTPMMKNIFDPTLNINTEILNDVIDRLKASGDCATHENGNQGWFNPEIMKCVLDDICEENSIKILFETQVLKVNTEKKLIKNIEIFNNSGKSIIRAKEFIDATGSAEIAEMAGLSVNNADKKSHQAVSLRFNMSGVNVEKFAKWIRQIDKDEDVTSICRGENNEILLTTAYTWDSDKWALKPYFDKAVQEGVLKEKDTAYFQIFSIPGQNSTIAFNCPRISSVNFIDVLNQEELSRAYVIGRKQIRRIAGFCKKYLVGFDNAYISQIAPQLGVRYSRKVKGLYELTEDDIMERKKFDNAVVRSDYPIDVHATKKNYSKLIHSDNKDYYEIPLECLMSDNIQNLMIVGKSISATFLAQASLRIQPNCWFMGEAAGKVIAERLKHGK